MARIVLFLFALFASLFAAFASPVSVQDGQLLEKRIQRNGRGTWYYPGLGNCGKYNTKNDFIVAMGKAFYDRNGGSNCGQGMYIVNTANGKSVSATLMDSCESCGDDDIDMSPAVFEQISTLETGQIEVTWHFQPR